MHHRSPRTSRRTAGWGLCLLTLAASSLPATAAQPRRVPTATPPPVIATGCEEHEAWVDGDAAAVASRLPKGYVAVSDSNGAPIVFARAERCAHLTAAGRTAASTIADWGVVVQTPDGHGCASGVPTVGAIKGDVPPACNWYTLGLVSDDHRIVDWLRHETPDVPATVAHVVYRLGAPDALGRSAFHFSVARGASPFTIDDVSSFRPGSISLRGSYWFNTRRGIVRVVVSTDDLTAGHADTTLRAPMRSPLARLMGAPTRASVAPYADFGVIRAAHGVERKQLYGPALRGERLVRFGGSCTLQGDVTFHPPATDAQAPTVYSYDATGTCTGRLNGRSVDTIPVHLRQSGHADASCMQAMAFPPGNGVVSFAGGARLPYTLDFTSKATELDGAAYGTRSGQATGHATFLTQRSSPTIVTDCATTGARVAPMDMSFSTDSELVSDVT